MTRALLLLSFLFSLTSFAPQADCFVRDDGIYTATVDADVDAHIRFYKDGVVIVSTSEKNIKDVNKWFTRDNIDRVLKGKYKVKGCSLKFKVKGETGEQAFQGIINGNSLQMTVSNPKTKGSTERTYVFVKL